MSQNKYFNIVIIDSWIDYYTQKMYIIFEVKNTGIWRLLENKTKAQGGKIE